MQDENMKLWHQVNNLSVEIMREATNIPVAELDRDYRMVELAPLMVDMHRHMISVKLGETPGILDIHAEDDAPKDIIEQVQECSGDLAETIFFDHLRLPDNNMRDVGKALTLAARLVHDRSRHSLLTSRECGVLASAMQVVFGDILKGMIHQNHPGDIQGSA